MAILRSGDEEEEIRNSRVLAMLVVLETLQWCYKSKKGADSFKKDLNDFKSGVTNQIFTGADDYTSVKIMNDVVEVEYANFDNIREVPFFGRWEFSPDEIIPLFEDAIKYGERYGEPSKYFP